MSLEQNVKDGGIEVLRRSWTVPLWSKRDTNYLLNKRAEMGGRAYARGFQQKVISDEEILFKNIETMKIEDGFRATLIQPHWPRFAGLDLSSVKRPGTVMTIAAVDENKHRWIIDMIRGRWTSPQTTENVHELMLRHNVNHIMVENNAYQMALVEWMIEKYGGEIPVQGFCTGSNKANEELGLPSMEVELENGTWHVCMGDYAGHDKLACECGICTFFREALTYPLSDTSDCIMSWWFAREAIRFGTLNTGPRIRIL